MRPHHRMANYFLIFFNFNFNFINKKRCTLCAPEDDCDSETGADGLQ